MIFQSSFSSLLEVLSPNDHHRPSEYDHHHIPELILIGACAHLAVKVNHMDLEATFRITSYEDEDDNEDEDDISIRRG